MYFKLRYVKIGIKKKQKNIDLLMQVISTNENNYNGYFGVESGPKSSGHETNFHRSVHIYSFADITSIDPS